MNNKIYCYIRVSTDKQDYDRQKNILEERGYINGVNCEYIEETGTGKNKNRPALTSLISKLQPHDTVVSCELSRISRSVKDFNYLIDLILKDKKANIIILKENFNLLANGNMDAMTRLILNITSAFAEFERDLISDRTKESLRAKKIHGTKSGKPTGKPRGKEASLERFKFSLDYMIKNNVGQQKASLITRYPSKTLFNDIKRCYNKYNTKSYQEILNNLESEGITSWEQF